MFCYPFEYVAFTRKEAQKEGHRFYRDGKPCKKGHWDKKNKRGACAQCDRDRAKVYKAKNREKAREHNRRGWEKKKAMYANDPDYRAREAYYGKMKARRYRNDPERIDHIRKQSTKYKLIEHERKYGVDERYTTTVIWRRMINRSVALGYKKNKRTHEELGYHPDEMRDHIASQFVDGMSWANHGEWEIDHIRPLCTFPIDTPASTVHALSNLRPLWKADNIRRSRKWQE